ncbi:hypothetical protein JRQ81_011702 [Phrynocephalus forsythii]|uniref:Uncharacterized protein n=1 Tax=Phrynocephalus forsythii TaxID=171643 RepID=A0A9Q0X6D8_9SAUR|nr:hypothetical protein JRQ81_011702 [Phrynocephalus forsythii]
MEKPASCLGGESLASWLLTKEVETPSPGEAHTSSPGFSPGLFLLTALGILQVMFNGLLEPETDTFAERCPSCTPCVLSFPTGKAPLDFFWTFMVVATFSSFLAITGLILLTALGIFQVMFNRLLETGTDILDERYPSCTPCGLFSNRYLLFPTVLTFQNLLRSCAFTFGMEEVKYGSPVWKAKLQRD